MGSVIGQQNELTLHEKSYKPKVMMVPLPYLFLRGGLRPALRPSINCGPMLNPNITKG